MSRPTLEVADIFRAQADNFINKHDLGVQQLKVIRAIVRCPTAVLGGHVDVCPRCGGDPAISYNSCRNRHCNKCQAQARRRWIDARKLEVLPTRYFHVVFTLPHELHTLILQNQAELYNLLFRTVAETLREVARNPKNLGAEIGFFGILHTWGQNLLFHPHIHCVIPGGGISPNKERWIHPKYPFFLPARQSSRQSVSWKVRRRAPTRSSQETADLRRIDPPSGGTKILRGVPPNTVSSELGCLCQTRLRRPGTGHPLSRPLYSSCRHLQPSDRLLRCRTRYLPLARLHWREQDEHDDRHGVRVHPPIPASRLAQVIRPQP